MEKIFFKDKEVSCEMIINILKEIDEIFLKFLPIHLEFFGVETRKLEIDEELKKKVLQFHISKIILKKAKENKLLIFFDNLHWFDSLSLELLISFIKYFEKEKLFIIIAGRELFEKNRLENSKYCKFINLKELKITDVKFLIEELLCGTVKEELLKIIMEQTKGNPFYIFNLINYLKEKELIEKHLNEWTIKRGIEIKKEYSLDDIISAKISNLSIHEKMHIRVAASIGYIFIKDILNIVLGKYYKEYIFQDLIKKDYFIHLDKANISFRYNLIQETIYKEIPERLRKKNHRRIGKVMEKVFNERIKEYFPNLANHFYLGGVKDKAAFYSLKAGDFLFERYAYPEAKYFYERAFKIFKKNIKDVKLESGMKYSKTMIRIGEIKKSLEILKKIIEISIKNNRKDIFLDCQILKMEGLKRLSNFSFIKKAEKLLNIVKDREKQNHIKCLVAEGLLRTGNFEKSLNLFYKVLEEKKFALKEDITYAYTFILQILTIQNKLDKAFFIYKKAIKFAEKENDFYQIIRLKIAYAGALYENSEINSALNLMKSLIKLAENLGDYYYLSSIYLNIGLFLIDNKSYDEAFKYLKEAENSFEKIGSIEGLARCYNFMGVLNFFKNNYKDSYYYYSKALKLFIGINERVEILWIYYNLAEVCFFIKNKTEASKWYKEGLSSFKKEDNPKLYGMFLELGEKINSM